MEESENTPKKGYGKRPLWQWVLLYLVIGGIIYFLIYYFVIAKSGNPYHSGNQPASSTKSSGY